MILEDCRGESVCYCTYPLPVQTFRSVSNRKRCQPAAILALLTHRRQNKHGARQPDEIMCTWITLNDYLFLFQMLWTRYFNVTPIMDAFNYMLRSEAGVLFLLLGWHIIWMAIFSLCFARVNEGYILVLRRISGCRCYEWLYRRDRVCCLGYKFGIYFSCCVNDGLNISLPYLELFDLFVCLNLVYVILEVKSINVTGRGIFGYK